MGLPPSHGEVIEQIQKVTLPGGTQKIANASVVLFKDFSGKQRPNLLKKFPQGPDLTESSVSSQAFVHDTDYLLVKTIDEYDARGNPLNESDEKKNRVGYHYSPNQYVPSIVTILNAKSKQVVFEGFEFATGYGLTLSGGTASDTTGWTGERALLLTSAMTLSNSAIERESGMNTLVVSGWVNAAQNSTITVRAKNGGATLDSEDFSYTTLNQWTYFEKLLNIASGPTAPSTFLVEVVSNATVQIDDILFKPISVTTSLRTYRPLTGLTSETDDRGNSVKIIYDSVGRVVSKLDRKRNLVEKKEYHTQLEGLLLPDPSFTSSATSYEVGDTVTFTSSEENCLTTSYEWKVTFQSTTSTYTTSSINHAFTMVGLHNVKLKVTNSNGSRSYVKEICVQQNFISIELTASLLEFDCPNSNLTFTVTNPPDGGCVISYAWYYTDTNGNWIYYMEPSSYNSPEIHLDFQRDYNVKVRVTSVCDELQQSMTNPCNGRVTTVVESNSVHLDYEENSQC